MKLAGVVIAAGEGRRMGRLKQLLPWKNSTVLGTIIDTLKDTSLEKIYIVLGYKHEDVFSGIKKHLSEKTEVVINNRYKEGMLSSIQEAVKRIPDDFYGFLLFLGDQPFVKKETVEKVVERAKMGDYPIIVACFKGERGHPTFVSLSLKEKILSLSPTLVIGQTFNQATLEKLNYFKIKTLKVKLKTIQDIKKSISLIAKEINSKEDTHLINDITNAFKKNSKTKKPHSVMIVYGLREDLRNATYVAGHNIFFEDIIHSCGNTNAYTEESIAQPVLNYENIIAINPDQIIILQALSFLYTQRVWCIEGILAVEGSELQDEWVRNFQRSAAKRKIVPNLEVFLNPSKP